MVKRQYRYSHPFHDLYVLSTGRAHVRIRAVAQPQTKVGRRARIRWNLTIDGADSGTFDTFREAEARIPPEIGQASLVGARHRR